MGVGRGGNGPKWESAQVEVGRSGNGLLTDGQFLKNALGGNGASRFAYQQAGFQYP